MDDLYYSDKIVELPSRPSRWNASQLPAGWISFIGDGSGLDLEDIIIETRWWWIDDDGCFKQSGTSSSERADNWQIGTNQQC